MIKSGVMGWDLAAACWYYCKRKRILGNCTTEKVRRKKLCNCWLWINPCIKSQIAHIQQLHSIPHHQCLDKIYDVAKERKLKPSQTTAEHFANLFPTCLSHSKNKCIHGEYLASSSICFILESHGKNANNKGMTSLINCPPYLLEITFT